MKPKYKKIKLECPYCKYKDKHNTAMYMDSNFSHFCSRCKKGYNNRCVNGKLITTKYE